MKWMNGALLTGILAFLFFLAAGIRYKSLQEQYLDRIWLDEELSMAAKDAVQDCLSRLEPDTSLSPEPVWERFLLAYQAFGGRADRDRAADSASRSDIMEGDSVHITDGTEAFPAAILAVREGMYPYDREQGWGTLLPWEEDRVRQMTDWLCACLKGDERSSSKGIPYEIRLPYTSKEEWARTPGENCLIVLYEGEGREMADTGYYRLAVGGAQYRKRTLWYIWQGTDGYSYYHQKNCSALSVLSAKEVYYTIEECAVRGALPCPVCMQ